MSIKTWKKEFFSGLSKAVKSRRAAIAHSLRKWTGLLPANLKKHHVRQPEMSAYIDDEDFNVFDVDGASCALCYKYDLNGCIKCPLYQTLTHRCDECDGPYTHWCDTGDPRPMIKALKKCK